MAKRPVIKKTTQKTAAPVAPQKRKGRHLRALRVVMIVTRNLAPSKKEAPELLMIQSQMRKSPFKKTKTASTRLKSRSGR